MPVVIPVTGGYVAVIDDADAELVLRHKWRAATHGRYAQTNVGKRTVFMHRLIMAPPEGFETDHVDGDGLNNKRDNLRLATRSQNRANNHSQVRNKHGFRGVIQTARGYFYGRVNKYGKQHFTASFNTPEAASIARNRLAIQLYGEFVPPSEAPQPGIVLCARRGFPGVVSSGAGRFYGRVLKSGHHHYTALFDNPEDAALARCVLVASLASMLAESPAPAPRAVQPDLLAALAAGQDGAA
jgi:hypothetical protein